MRWMATLGVAALVATAALAESGKEKAKPLYIYGEELERPVSVAFAGETLAKALGALGRQGRVEIVLDAALPSRASETPISYTASDVPLGVALGNVLRVAGLRYAVETGGRLFVSTPGRLARRLIYGTRRTSSPEAEPMDTAEAMDILSPRIEDPYEEMPWTQWDIVVVNPVTGINDYPAPPVFGTPSNRYDEPRFRYTDRPFYLKPTYLDAEARGAGMSEREILLRLVELIRRNPDWVQSELMRLHRGAIQ